MNMINGGVCAAKGFKANGIHCGIRKNRTKRDLALIVSDVPAKAAAVYTTNLVKGAPLAVTKENIKDEGTYRVVATPTRNGVLFGEVWAEFEVVKSDTVILGDADGDGKVTILDATAIQKMKASIDVPFFNETAANVDKDNVVSVLDATWIQKYLASIPCPEGIGKPIA